MTFSQELETLIRARYPIIYVVTSEETRMQKVVVEVAQKREKKAFDKDLEAEARKAVSEFKAQFKQSIK